MEDDTEAVPTTSSLLRLIDEIDPADLDIDDEAEQAAREVLDAVERDRREQGGLGLLLKLTGAESG